MHSRGFPLSSCVESNMIATIHIPSITSLNPATCLIRVFLRGSRRYLKSRLLSGGGWVFANKFLSGIFFIARTAILARLLSPSEFGTAGLALAAVGTISIFTNSGFHQAIVQKKEDVDKDLDTIWVVSVSRGIFSFAAIFLLAPYIAMFFKSDGLSTVIQVIGLDFIFRGLINPGTVYFHRELNFKKILILEACEYGCVSLVAVVWALFSPSVWALVVSVPAGSAASAICSFLIHPYRPRLQFDLGRARNLFRFGRWVFFGNVFFYFIFQMDSIVIGRILGDKALGFYQISSRVANLSRHAHYPDDIAPYLSHVCQAARQTRPFAKSLLGTIANSVVCALAGFGFSISLCPRNH